MDIDLLSKMIKELILDTDEVPLPGVGSFVAEIVPSTFSDKGYTINPPYRRLSFRQRQTEENTLLSDFYAESNNLDKASAELIINDFLREMKEVLQEKKTIIFPGLGRLRATRENNFFFVADEDLDIYPAGFGLAAVSLKTHEETPEAVSATLSSLKDMMAGTETMVPVPAVEPPIQEPEPTIQEEPEPTVAEPEPVLPEPVTEPVPTQEPEPTPAEPEPTPEPTPEPVRQKTLLEEADYYTNPESSYTHAKKAGKTLLMAILWIVLVAAALLILFILLAHIAPDFIDRILYTKEELEILRY